MSTYNNRRFPNQSEQGYTIFISGKQIAAARWLVYAMRAKQLSNFHTEAWMCIAMPAGKGCAFYNHYNTRYEKISLPNNYYILYCKHR